LVVFRLHAANKINKISSETSVVWKRWLIVSNQPTGGWLEDAVGCPSLRDLVTLGVVEGDPYITEVLLGTKVELATLELLELIVRLSEILPAANIDRLRQMVGRHITEWSANSLQMHLSV
jgi:hypothetical protein